MGRVDVTLPDRTAGFGHIFHIEINDLNGGQPWPTFTVAPATPR
jgi:hypothetical protein